MATRIQDIIINDILQNIQEGNLKPGEKLPTNLELAQKYHTSGVTVRKSIAALVSRGVLESIERVGTFVKKREHEVFLIKFSPYSSINEEITSEVIEDVNLTLARIPGSRHEQKSLQFKQIFFSESIPICYHILTIYINSRPHTNHLDQYADRILSHMTRYIESFETKKEIEISMEAPQKYIQQKLLIDENTPVFCFSLSYMTRDRKHFGKSTYYVSGENIALQGKSV